jgi:hypothetical protein
MKKIAYLFIAMMMFVPFTTYAAGVNGVTTQGEGKMGIGADLDYTFTKEMDLESEDLGFDVNDVKIEEYYAAYATLSYGLSNNWDIYGKLGFSDFNTNGTIGDVTFDSDADMALAYAIGTKCSYPLQGGYIVGADLRYSMASYDSALDYGNVDGDVDWTQWHVAPFVGMVMQDMTPYAGVKWSQTSVEHDFEELGSFDIEGSDDFGVFAGVDFIAAQNMVVNVEGRLMDEEAITLGVTWKY